MEDPRLAEYYAAPIGIRKISKTLFSDRAPKVEEKKDERNNYHVHTSTTSVPVHVCMYIYIHSLATTAMSTKQPDCRRISFGVIRQQGSLITNVTCSLCGAHSRSRLCAA